MLKIALKIAQFRQDLIFDYIVEWEIITNSYVTVDVC